MNGNKNGFDKELTITLKCFFGFEETLKEELIEYGYNDSDGILIDKHTAEQIGHLDADGTIDYFGNGQETHRKNMENQ